MGRPPKATTQITLMVPDELLRQAEEVAVLWSRPGVPVTRLDVLRAAAVRAIPLFHAEATDRIEDEREPSAKRTKTKR